MQIKTEFGAHHHGKNVFVAGFYLDFMKGNISVVVRHTDVEMYCVVFPKCRLGQQRVI